MPVRAGTLNKPATLQVKTRVPDGNGGHAETWAAATDPYWVSIKPVRGREVFEVGQRFSAVTHKLEGWYQAGISAATHRILYGTRVFRIESVVNPAERNETLEYMCEESPAVPERQA